MTAKAQILTIHRDAKKSTDPRSKKGKAVISKNTDKHDIVMPFIHNAQVVTVFSPKISYLF